MAKGRGGIRSQIRSRLGRGSSRSSQPSFWKGPRGQGLNLPPPEAGPSIPATPGGLSTIRGYWRADTDVFSDSGGTTASVDGAAEALRWDDQGGSNDIVFSSARDYDTTPDVGTYASPNIRFNSGVVAEDIFSFTAADPMCIGMVSTNAGLGIGYGVHVGRVTTAGGWAICQDASDVWKVVLIDAFSSSMIEVNGDTALVANDAAHVFFDYDGSKTAAGVRLWVNGTLQTPTVVHDTLSTNDIIDAAARFRLGFHGSFGGNAGARMTEVTVAQETITQDHIDTWYAQAQTDYGI